MISSFGCLKKTIIIILFLSYITFCSCSISPSYADEVSEGDRYMQDCLSFYKRGHFNYALSHGLNAKEFYEREGKIRELIETNVLLSSIYQDLGLYKKSLHQLKTALPLAKKK
jgi:hypothetical protein